MNFVGFVNFFFWFLGVSLFLLAIAFFLFLAYQAVKDWIDENRQRRKHAIEGKLLEAQFLMHLLKKLKWDKEAFAKELGDFASQTKSERELRASELMQSQPIGAIEGMSFLQYLLMEEERTRKSSSGQKED